MKVFKYVVLVSVVTIGLISYVFWKKSVEKVDLGTIKDSVYENKYFGFTVRIPDKWKVQDAKAKRTMIDLGKKIAFGEDKNVKAVIDASELHTLLAVSKYPLGFPVPSNPNFICMAEKVDHFPGIKKGRDYLYHIKRSFALSQVKPTFAKETYSVKLGGVGFDVLDGEMKLGIMVVRQKYYSTIIKGYALSFIISFTTEEELKSLNQILESVNFK